MNSIPKTNINFSGIHSITYRENTGLLPVVQRMEDLVMNSTAIKKLAIVRNLDLVLSTSSKNKQCHADIIVPGYGYATLTAKKYNGLADFPKNTNNLSYDILKKILKVSSKFNQKLSGAKEICNYLNSNETDKLHYYTITPKKTIKINNNLSISTKDVAIAEYTNGKTRLKRVINVDA